MRDDFISPNTDELVRRHACLCKLNHSYHHLELQILFSNCIGFFFVLHITYLIVNDSSLHIFNLCNLFDFLI